MKICRLIKIGGDGSLWFDIARRVKPDRGQHCTHLGLSAAAAAASSAVSAPGQDNQVNVSAESEQQQATGGGGGAREQPITKGKDFSSLQSSIVFTVVEKYKGDIFEKVECS